MLVGVDQSEFISGGLVSVYLVYGKVAVVVFASSCGIRQSKLPTQHVRPESGRWFPLVWCKHVFVSQNIKRCESFEEPVHWIGQFIAFAIYLDSCNIIINSCFDFSNVGGGVNCSGNRQNLHKTKWRPWCWNPRFGTFRCYSRTVTML